MKCEVERSILSPRKENFSGKRDFLKGRPNFPKGISEWKILLVPRLLAWIAFDAIFREKVWKWNEGIPEEISIQDLTRAVYYNCRPTGFSE